MYILHLVLKMVPVVTTVNSLRDNGFASRRVSRYEHRLVVLETQQCFFLKWIKNERIFLRRLGSSDNQWNVFHAGRNGHFMCACLDRLQTMNLNPRHHLCQTTKPRLQLLITVVNINNHYHHPRRYVNDHDYRQNHHNPPLPMYQSQY